jgi:hypothetical protein
MGDSSEASMHASGEVDECVCLGAMLLWACLCDGKGSCCGPTKHRTWLQGQPVLQIYQIQVLLLNDFSSITALPEIVCGGGSHWTLQHAVLNTQNPSLEGSLHF